MKPDLTKLGLTQNEAVIYLSLLEKGPSIAGNLSRRTGIHRRTIYDITDRLIEKGLIGYIIENNRKYFHATHPERFQELLKEQETLLQTYTPELTAHYHATHPEQTTLFYRGKRGLKAVFDDQLRTKEEILIIGASAQAYTTLAYYFPHYDKERQQKKIPAKIIFNHDAKKLKKRIPLATIKYLPEELATPSATNIYGDTVSIILWGENPYAIMIKDKAIAKSYKNYFQLLWKAAQR